MSWSEFAAALGSDAVATSGPDVRILRVVVEHEPEELAPGDVVLAIGVESDAATQRLLTMVGASAAAGVVVHSRHADPERTASAADQARCPVVVLSRTANWVEVIERTNRLFGMPEELDGPGDLVGVAEAAAEIAGGSVTVEDRHGQLLAYGGSHADADAARIATILGRRVPEEVSEQLRAAGVYELVRQSQTAVVLPSVSGLAPRMAVAIRSGGEQLGTAWALLSQQPDEQTLSAFTRCAALAAVHILRATRPSSPMPRVENEAMSALLYGGAGAGAAARALGLLDQEVRVAIVAVHGGDIADATRLRARLRARLLALTDQSSASVRVADLNGTLYVLLATTQPDPTQQTPSWLNTVVRGDLTSMASGAPRVLAGIGRPTQTASLPQSRAEAELALAVSASGAVPSAVVRYVDVWALSFLQRLSDLPLAAELVTAGPVVVLDGHDKQHDTHLLATLEAHLLFGGDARAAGESLHVHPNTFRYRMRRIAELTQLDLHDLNTRAAVTVQLALRRLNWDR